MIYGFMSIYDEKEHVASAIESLKLICDKILILDGTPKDFPAKPDRRSYADSPQSTDETIEIIKDLQARGYPIELFKSKEVWQNEAEKKNYLLNKIPSNSKVIQLDGDEELRLLATPQDVKKYIENTKEIKVPIIFTSHASWISPSFQVMLQPRMWINKADRLFSPPSKEQLVKFGQFVSQPLTPSEKPQMPHLAPKMPEIPFLVINNPTIRNTERQKRRLIYYERIFDQKII